LNANFIKITEIYTDREIECGNEKETERERVRKRERGRKRERDRECKTQCKQSETERDEVDVL